MKLHELMKSLDRDDVINRIIELYPDSHFDSYAHAWNKLEDMEPGDAKGGTIVIQKWEESYSVSGRYPGDDSLYAIELNPWKEWLDMTYECPAGMPLVDMLAHILWEMTFSGYNPEEVEEKADEIKTMVADIMKREGIEPNEDDTR